MKKKKTESKKDEDKFTQEMWIRLAVLIVAVILAYPIAMLLLLLVLVNIIITLIKKEPNKKLVKFSNAGLEEMFNVLRYLLFVSNKRPFKL
ncbi:MAG: DUF4389 domain-containing protein [Nanoarchaeota archaeon]|nr:DUF4389 domain-containing protein [Nanoarchaeota archaeon]